MADAKKIVSLLLVIGTIGLTSSGCVPARDEIGYQAYLKNKMMKEESEERIMRERMLTPFEREQRARMQSLYPRHPEYPGTNQNLDELGR
jgi:hypothetical protein